MAGEPIPASALSPPSRHVATAGSGARRVDRGPWVIPQPVEPKRFRPGRRMAVGDAATPWPLSIVGNIGGARLGQDCPVENAQGLGRSKCRSGAGPAA